MNANWKSAIQVRDLDPDDRLQLLCRRCGTHRFITGAEIMAHKGAEWLWLYEVEARARCRQRGCGGAMRLSWPASGETVSFVGGLT